MNPFIGISSIYIRTHTFFLSLFTHTHTHKGKLLGAAWTALAPTDKKQYEAMHDEDVLRCVCLCAGGLCASVNVCSVCGV
jgi:hypothetical protein